MRGSTALRPSAWLGDWSGRRVEIWVGVAELGPVPLGSGMAQLPGPILEQHLDSGALDLCDHALTELGVAEQCPLGELAGHGIGHEGRVRLPGYVVRPAVVFLRRLGHERVFIVRVASASASD